MLDTTDPKPYDVAASKFIAPDTNYTFPTIVQPSPVPSLAPPPYRVCRHRSSLIPFIALVFTFGLVAYIVSGKIRVPA